MEERNTSVIFENTELRCMTKQSTHHRAKHVVVIQCPSNIVEVGWIRPYVTIHQHVKYLKQSKGLVCDIPITKPHTDSA